MRHEAFSAINQLLGLSNIQITQSVASLSSGRHPLLNKGFPLSPPHTMTRVQLVYG